MKEAPGSGGEVGKEALARGESQEGEKIRHEIFFSLASWMSIFGRLLATAKVAIANAVGISLGY